MFKISFFLLLIYFFLKIVNDTPLKSATLQQNESIPLNVPNERQTGGRLSVIADQSFKRRQEFTVKVKIKFIYFSINEKKINF